MYNNNINILITVTYHNLIMLIHKFFLNQGLKYKKNDINKIILVTYKYKSWMTFGLNGIGLLMWMNLSLKPIGA